MRPVEARPSRAAHVVVFLVAAVGLLGCSSTTHGPDASSRRTPPSIDVPLNATMATTSGATAVVPMGMLGDPLETFWQVFFRPGTTAPWEFVTPPGVADNGGVVLSPGSGATDLFAGFEPSQALVYSPVALSVDQGRSWSPGLVQGGLAAVPDALTARAGSGSAALVRNGGGEVLRSPGTSSIGSKVASRDAIAASGAGRTCGVGDLTAVAFDDTGGLLVGATCTARGVVGIFRVEGRSWRVLGPRITGGPGSAPTKVLRLVEVDGAVNGLVAVGSGSVAGIIGVAASGVGGWTRSPALPLGPEDRIASTGVEPGGGFAVLVQRPDRSLALELETGPGGPWHATTAPPRGAAAVVVGTGGLVDALTVASTRLTDWRLDTSTASWTKIGAVTVPIQFGSSS